MIYPTLTPPLLELWHVHRFAPGAADTAVDRVLDDKRAQRLALRAAIDIEHERVALGVLATRSSTAEPARGERRSLADPAVHSRSPNGPAEAGTDIMARSGPEITH